MHPLAVTTMDMQDAEPFLHHLQHAEATAHHHPAEATFLHPLAEAFHLLAEAPLPLLHAVISVAQMQHHWDVAVQDPDRDPLCHHAEDDPSLDRFHARLSVDARDRAPSARTTLGAGAGAEAEDSEAAALVQAAAALAAVGDPPVDPEEEQEEEDVEVGVAV